MNASNGSKHVAYSGSEQCGANAPPYSLVLPITIGSPALVEEGGLAPKSAKTRQIQ